MFQCVSKVSKLDNIITRAGISFSLCLALCGWGFSLPVAAYSVVELSPVNDNFAPELNDNDNVVWYGLDATDGDYDIFYYDGTTTAKVVDNSFSEFSPKISNNGVIVWYGNNKGFNVFSNIGGFSNISGFSVIDPQPDKLKVGLSPEINVLDNVVWFGTDFDPTDDYEIYFYDGNPAVAITDNAVDDKEAKINDLGKIVWQRDVNGDGSDWDIYFYDGVTTSSIGTDLVGNDQFPQINNAVTPQVVWRHGTSPNTVIRLWTGAGAITLSEVSTTDNKWPQINDVGQVVWQGKGVGDFYSEIYFYDSGTGVRKLTNNDFDDLEPKINNNGVVTWRRSSVGVDSEVFVWNSVDGEVQVSSDNCENLNVSINDNNTLVWWAKDGANSRIILAIDDGLDNPPPSSIQCAVTSTSSAPSSSRKGDSGGCALNTRAGFDPVLIFLLFLSMLYVWRKHPSNPLVR